MLDPLAFSVPAIRKRKAVSETKPKRVRSVETW
jgi:hypothetical protein